MAIKLSNLKKPELIRAAIQNYIHKRKSFLLWSPALEADEKPFLDDLQNETDPEALITRLLSRAKIAQDQADAASEKLEELKQRKQRFGQERQELRDLAKSVMEIAQIKQLDNAWLKVKLAKSWPKIEIFDELSVPDDYCKIERRIVKTKIKEAIQAGKTVPGATMLDNEQHLTVQYRSEEYPIHRPGQGEGSVLASTNSE